ncbi:MAG: transglycosylase domain-containing protein [Verrucomicrobiota bacterium]
MFESEYRYKPPFYLRRWVHVVVLLFLVTGIAGSIFVYVKLKPYKEKAEEFSFADINKLEKASIIYDREGVELGRIFVLNRDPVPIEKIPHHLIDAVVATEDSRFFDHDGVDRWGMIRAAIRNIKARSFKQGASTITQQLARNAYGMRARSYERKLIEAFLAMRIERNFSKSQIMGMYLNRIYFGSGYYGVNAASKGYFGKEVSEVYIGEAATLAGLIKSPNKLSPLNNPDWSKRERNYVFRRMGAENMLTPKEVKELSATALSVNPAKNEKKKAFEYAYQQVRMKVVEQLGDQASTGGFHIFTTIDARLQQAAYNSLTAHLDRIETHPDYDGQTYADYELVLKEWKRRMAEEEEEPAMGEKDRPVPDYIQGALIALDNRTGGIRAMVGGREFLHSQFDRTIQARRKPGTAFTPFVYAAGMASGKLPGEKVDDSPMDNRYVQIGGIGGILGEWGVEGPYRREGFLPARMALVKGKNAATVRFGLNFGLEKIVDFAKRAGITFEGDLQNYNSTMLGQSEASIQEMALAYTIFPNLGNRPESPYLIQSIRDDRAKTIFRVESKGPVIEVMDAYPAYQMHNALSDVLRIGTGKESWERYGLEDLPVAGKTGTTSEFRDTWFIGYSNHITCAVWAGYDRAKTIYPAAFSNETVLPLWADFMKDANKVVPAETIQAPASGQSVEVCLISGDLATEHCYHVEEGEGGEERQVRDTYMEVFAPRINYARRCAVHRPGGTLNYALLRPIGIGEISPIDISAISRVKPVLLRGPIVIGEDPYNSIPLYKRLRVTKKKKVEEPVVEEESEDGSLMPATGDDEGESEMREEGTEEAPATPVGPPGPFADAGTEGGIAPRVVQAGGDYSSVLQPGIRPSPSEPGPPAPTEDGLPSIFEEGSRYRVTQPEAARIQFE